MQMELEFSRKNESSLKIEKEELKQIISGLKAHIDTIEGQRDHFEERHDQAHQNFISIRQEHDEVIKS